MQRSSKRRLLLRSIAKKRKEIGRWELPSLVITMSMWRCVYIARVGILANSFLFFFIFRLYLLKRAFPCVFVRCINKYLLITPLSLSLSHTHTLSFSLKVCLSFQHIRTSLSSFHNYLAIVPLGISSV